MAGAKRPYPFSPEYPPECSFYCKKCCVAFVSRSNESTSSSNECSSMWKSEMRLKEVVSKSRALSESVPSSSLREIKGLNGDFLRLAPPAEALLHLGVVNRHFLTDSSPKCLQLFNYVPSRVAAAEPTPPSGSVAVQHPILRFFPSAKVQIGQEGTRGSDIRTEVRRRKY